MSAISDSKIVNVTDFEIYLAEIKNNKNDVLIFFQVLTETFSISYLNPIK